MARKKKDDDDERPNPFASGTNDAAERLEEFITQIEEKMATVAETQEEIREIFKELNGVGYEATIVRRVIALRKKKRQNAERFDRDEAVFEQYCSALGIFSDY